MSTAKGKSDLTPVEDLTYKDAVAELDQIVSQLDSGSVDVDNLVAQFERAVNIVEQLEARVKVAKDKLEELTPRLAMEDQE